MMDFLELVEDSKKRIREVSVKRVAEKMSATEKFHLIDVREDREWLAGHIQGAFHLGKGIIERDIEAHVPHHEDEIILYCGGGYRSALAAEALIKMGYTQVYSMAGGIRDWAQLGLPMEEGSL